MLLTDTKKNSLVPESIPYKTNNILTQFDELHCKINILVVLIKINRFRYTSCNTNLSLKSASNNLHHKLDRASPL